MKNKGTIRKVLLVSMCVIFVLCLSLLFFIGLGDFLGWLLLTMVIVAAAAAIVVCIAMRDEKKRCRKQ